MYNKIKKYIIYCLICLGLFSCEKILQPDIESDITAQNYWKNESDFQNYLTGIYSYFRDRMNTLDFGADRSGFFVPGNLSRFSPFWSQVITPDNTADWRPYYATIGHCNLLLSEIRTFKFSNNDDKDRIIAETLSLRAAMYFFIAKVYGDVPLMLKAVEDEDVPFKKRAPVLDVFKQIDNDIDSALSMYPKKGIRDKYHFSSASTNALKANVYVWQAKVLGYNVTSSLQSAINAIDSIQKNSGVKLLDDFGNITKKKNDEIILSLFENREEGPMYAKYAFPIEAYAGSADNADNLPIAASASTGLGTYTLSPIALALFNKYPTDKRIPHTYVTEIDHGSPGHTWPNKFRGHIYSDGRIADDDIIQYRLGGILLLKAEAYAALVEPSKALIPLNKVRKRAGIPDFNSSDIGKINKEILDERGRELFFENKRWWDLVRAYKWGTIDIYKTIPNLVGKTTPIYWPVSTETLATNHSITQTPGY